MPRHGAEDRRFFERRERMSSELLLRESSFSGIRGAEKQAAPPEPTEQQKSLLESADRKIRERRRRESEAYSASEAYTGIRLLS